MEHKLVTSSMTVGRFSKVSEARCTGCDFKLAYNNLSLSSVEREFNEHHKPFLDWPQGSMWSA